MEQLEEIVRVFLFTDLVGSTDLKQQLGDSDAARLIATHNEIFRRCLANFDGHEEANPGDGFFATFNLPSQAVLCALAFQTNLSSQVSTNALKARVGIHMGQTVRVNEPTGANSALLGLSVDTAARIMSLAEPGQILITRSAFDSVRQYVRTGPKDEPLEWLAHGTYRLTGVTEPIHVFEVGVRGVSPLRAPIGSHKAIRDLDENAAVTGWRPAAGQTVPGRSDWTIEQKLGEGGFGEAWLAIHRKLHERRVFKFCFQPERLRALKREIALFRVLRDSLGERPDIARILDWHVESMPYYLESEYASGGSLPDWFDSQGGIQAVSLETRLEIVARTAEAVGAAHAVGVIHRDIKPSNVLVTGGSDGVPRVRLTDFGIGLIANPKELEERGVSLGSFPASMLADGSSSSTGTRLYMAPELSIGAPVSIYSDIYSIGVFLYQLVAGDLRRPVGIGWERDVGDPLLREDVAACIDREPSNRIASATELATRLRSLVPRRQAIAAEQALREEAINARRLAAKENERRRKQAYRTSLALTAFALMGMLIGSYQARHSTLAIQTAELVVHNQALQTCRAAAHWVAVSVAKQLDDAKRAVLLAANANQLSADVIRGDTKSIDSKLKWIGAGEPLTWVVVNNSGRLVGSFPTLPDETRQDMNLSDRPWFRGATQNASADVAISPPFRSVSGEQRAVLGISAPIRSDDSSANRSGLVLATMVIDDLMELIYETPFYSATGTGDTEGDTALSAVVLNERDELIVHPHNPLIATGNPAKWPIAEQVRVRQISNGASVLVDPLSGPHEAFFGAEEIHEYGWTVAVMLPKKVALRPIAALVQQLERTRWYYTIVSFGALLLAVTAGILFLRERRISRVDHETEGMA